MTRPATPAAAGAAPPEVRRFARHSPLTDPGRHASFLATAPHDPEPLAEVTASLLRHYVAAGVPVDEWASIDDRWVAAVLDRLTGAGSLGAPVPPDRRSVGCCRDFTLLFVAAMREHGVPARSRVGFAPYLPVGDVVCDHVVAEYWSEDRAAWVRVDPELPPAVVGVDVRDLGTGPGSAFRTAAEVWTAHRAGRLERGVERYGAVADERLRGEWMVGNYVLRELAHVTGHELLLWDFWGAMSLAPFAADGVLDRARRFAPHLTGERSADDLALLDHVAALLLDVDAHLDDLDALVRDPRLGPDAGVLCLSPSGRRGPVRLDGR